MLLSKCTWKVLQSLRLALLVCKWTKPGKRSLRSVSVLWRSLDSSFLEAIQAQETRGWVYRSLFPGGTRNPNLNQALDPFPSLPLLSEFLWNASPPVQIKHSSRLTTLPPSYSISGLDFQCPPLRMCSHGFVRSSYYYLNNRTLDKVHTCTFVAGRVTKCRGLPRTAGFSGMQNSSVWKLKQP